MILLFLFILLIAAIYDGLTTEIPLWLFFAALVGRIVDLIFFADRIWIYVGMGFMAFLITYLAARMGMIGGADALYYGLCGLYFGLYWLYVALFSCILSIPHGLIRKKGYPMLPYIFAGAVIITIWNQIGGMKWF